MTHKPIQIKNLNLSFAYKNCFEDFTSQISYGSRIVIIGRNGSGKSSLLKMLLREMTATSGDIKIPDDVIMGYVPQVIAEYDALSGGQRLNKAMTQALSIDPNVLLLDEPTNHLDQHNRSSLLRMLRAYQGTLIIVSHDTEVLRHCIDTLWHIDHGKIHVFSGNYDDYMHEICNKRATVEHELSLLKRQKKDMHHALMKEQQRAAKSKAKGEKSIDQRKWPTIVSKAKVTRASETTGRKQSAIAYKKQDLVDQLADLRLPEIIIPTFSLSSTDVGERLLISINDGSVGYQEQQIVLSNINLSLNSKDRIAITGTNGSGKSTLIKAILSYSEVITQGNWHLPKIIDIGYLDQHYSTLAAERSVFESIAELVPTWSHTEIRRHLCDFLFRKNEEVNALTSQLSGGEKALLSLAQIAAKTPKLLILDEITNNLDLEAKNHVIEVLQAYPGAMIVISHDADFLKSIGITDYYQILNHTLTQT